MNKKIKKTTVCCGYTCNNKCIFCIVEDNRYLKNNSTNFIKDKIFDAKRNGSTYLELIGGEITIRKDFFELINFAKNLKYETVMIATNGRMFSSQKFSEKAIKAGLNSVIFSIHGHNSDLHDNLTQSKGSFKELIEGVVNIKKISKKLKTEIYLGSNTCIVNQNYKYLPQIGKKIFKLGIKNSEFIFVDCNEGGAFRNFYELVPKISESAPYIHKCLDIGKKNNLNHWHVRYVPLCYFVDYLDRVSELQEIKHYSKMAYISEDVNNLDTHEGRKKWGRMKPEKCKKCKLNDKCEGLWKAYAEKYGTKELNIIK